MYRLAYVSTAAKSVSATDLQDILESAIRNNTKIGVTGTIIYNGASFLQILEGPQDKVEKIYAHICTDNRHNHIMTIFREKGAGRAFEDTPLTLNTVEGTDGKLPEGITVSADIDLFVPPGLPDHLRSMLKSFDTMRI
ncbi:BLUF domain-containing protein [Henriciella sp.]|uniref:BLUF domain-containing protein n=1 Tax=Henriciella sp. TaxID=1968823 RepID=UPI00261F1A20|nr:BLUF domain-containing protein [Henriciella sp.]